MRCYCSLLFLITITSVPCIHGQTDIGSASSAGGVTSDQSVGTLTPTKRLQLQQQQLDSYLTRLQQKFVQPASQNLAPMETADTKGIQDAYAAFRKAGNEISPFDFLAIATTVQKFSPGKLPDKTAEKIRLELESQNITKTNNAMFSELVGPSFLQAPTANAKQYKAELNKTKAELRKDLE